MKSIAGIKRFSRRKALRQTPPSDVPDVLVVTDVPKHEVPATLPDPETLIPSFTQVTLRDDLLVDKSDPKYTNAEVYPVTTVNGRVWPIWLIGHTDSSNKVWRATYLHQNVKDTDVRWFEFECPTAQHNESLRLLMTFTHKLFRVALVVRDRKLVDIEIIKVKHSEVAEPPTYPTQPSKPYLGLNWGAAGSSPVPEPIHETVDEVDEPGDPIAMQAPLPPEPTVTPPSAFLAIAARSPHGGLDFPLHPLDFVEQSSTATTPVELSDFGLSRYSQTDGRLPSMGAVIVLSTDPEGFVPIQSVLVYRDSHDRYVKLVVDMGTKPLWLELSLRNTRGKQLRPQALPAKGPYDLTAPALDPAAVLFLSWLDYRAQFPVHHDALAVRFDMTGRLVEFKAQSTRSDRKPELDEATRERWSQVWTEEALLALKRTAAKTETKLRWLVGQETKAVEQKAYAPTDLLKAEGPLLAKTETGYLFYPEAMYVARPTGVSQADIYLGWWNTQDTDDIEFARFDFDQVFDVEAATTLFLQYYWRSASVNVEVQLDEDLVIQALVFHPHHAFRTTYLNTQPKVAPEMIRVTQQPTAPDLSHAQSRKEFLQAYRQAHQDTNGQPMRVAIKALVKAFQDHDVCAPQTSHQPVNPAFSCFIDNRFGNATPSILERVVMGLPGLSQLFFSQEAVPGCNYLNIGLKLQTSNEVIPPVLDEFCFIDSTNRVFTAEEAFYQAGIPVDFMENLFQLVDAAPQGADLIISLTPELLVKKLSVSITPSKP